MSWFKRDKPDDEKLPKVEDSERRVRTEGLWLKCDGCRQIIWKKDLEANLNVCPKCGAHFRIDAVTRLKLLLRRWRVRAASTPACAPPTRWSSSTPSRTASGCAAMQRGHRPLRRADRRRAARSTAARCRSAPWSRSSSAAAWASWSARRSRAPSSAPSQQRMPAGHRLGLGRRAHDGGRARLMQMAKISAALERLDDERACPTSASSPIRPPAASPRASPCWAT